MNDETTAPEDLETSSGNGVPMDDHNALGVMVRSAYQLQMLRIQTGLRLAINFRQKLSISADEPLEQKVNPDDDEADAPKELSEKALTILDELKRSYRLICTGVAKHKDLPSAKGFVGNGLITTYAEAVLVHQYLALEREEAKQFKAMMGVLERIPIFVEWLSKQSGVGPAMAAVIITGFNIKRCDTVSAMWKYAGLDVAEDGFGRSRRKEHLVERTYIDRHGDEKTRMSVTYNPWVKTKLTGVLAGSFLRAKSPWRKEYDSYKTRIITDPNREKITVGEWKKRRNKLVADGLEPVQVQDALRHVWTPGRINNAAKRYMVKMFLVHLWTTWRKLEGLPVTVTWHEAKRGYTHMEHKPCGFGPIEGGAPPKIEDGVSPQAAA